MLLTTDGETEEDVFKTNPGDTAVRRVMRLVITLPILLVIKMESSHRHSHVVRSGVRSLPFHDLYIKKNSYNF